jgi:hypothetical protein
VKLSVSTCTECKFRGLAGRIVPSELYDNFLVRSLVVGFGVTLVNMDVNSLRITERNV